MLSLTARLAWLEQPCRAPCHKAADHALIFDEDYYVNAARVIAGQSPPPGEPYAKAPTGVDPNAEHPQLAKLVIAGSIQLFGDGPLAWRLASVVLGSLALLGLFVLVRAAGGGTWLALGAATLMGLDNLALVHGRIGTLDVYVLSAMIWGVAMYLRGRPILAGALIGVGACAKLLSPYALLVLGLFEGFRLIRARPDGSRRRSARRSLAALGSCTVSAAGTFLIVLSILDRVAPPYDPGTHRLLAGGLLPHIGHMLSFAAGQTSPHGPQGIASYPWQWIVDYKPIVYLNINPAHGAPGLHGLHPAVHFLGMVNPLILLPALPALVIAARNLRRPADERGSNGELGILGLAWFLGTLLPFELLNLIWSRTSYLYYMLLVMPAIYVLVAQLMSRTRPRSWPRVLWMLGVLAAAVVMYPFTPLP